MDLDSLLIALSRLGVAPRPAPRPMPGVFHSPYESGALNVGPRSQVRDTVGDPEPGRVPITMAPLLNQWIADPGGPTAPPAPLGPAPEPPKMPALAPSPVPDVLVLRPPRPLSSTALGSIALKALGGPPSDLSNDGGFKRGGLVRGGDPHSTTDDVAARLQHGEFVIPRDAVQHLAATAPDVLRHVMHITALHASGAKARQAAPAAQLTGQNGGPPPTGAGAPPLQPPGNGLVVPRGAVPQLAPGVLEHLVRVLALHRALSGTPSGSPWDRMVGPAQPAQAGSPSVG